MYTNRAHCRALRLMFALRKEQAYFINLNGICLRLRPKGVQGASGKPPASGMIRQLCRNQFPVGGIDAPTLARVVGLPPRGGSTFFRSERKYQRKPAARRLQRRPTSLRTAAKPCATLGLGYALHGLRPFLALVGLPWWWASVCGSRTVGCPEFIRGIQFRPLGRNSLTTFRGQTALRGCPLPRLAALTRREKALYCPFLKEGVRNVAHNGVG